jgi:hypothetical protein
MAKCVVHLKKIGGVGLGGVRNHMNRTGVSRTNPDIDEARSGQNYSPDGFSDAAHLEKRINARIKELNLKKAVRKDAVRLVDIVITSSREGMEAMGEDGKRAFFADAAAFLARRFGRENVMYANVHRDEAVDHMHLGFVPITRDGRLSAKSLLTRNSLKSLQTDFWREVGQKYGLERGEPALTPKEHIETERHKAEHAKIKATQEEERATQAEARARAAQTVNDEKAADVEQAANARAVLGGITARHVNPLLGDDYYRLAPEDYRKLREIAKKGATAIEEHVGMQCAVETAQKRERAAREGLKLAQKDKAAADARAKQLDREKDALKQEAAPYLNAPVEGRAIAQRGLAWARDVFRATWDTVVRHMARAVVFRGEKPRDTATRYAAPMKELGMEQGKWMPETAAKAFRQQASGRRAPAAPKGAGWKVHPDAVDYLASDAPREVLAEALSPAALQVIDESGVDGYEWDMMTVLEKDALRQRELAHSI